MQQFRPSDAMALDWFGRSVAVNERAGTVVVGAQNKTHDDFEAGAAYVFGRCGDTWSEVVRLTSPLPAARDLFGTAVSTSGSVVLVGMPRTSEEAGSAFAAGCRRSDLDGDGVVDLADLLMLLAAWGVCECTYPCPGDGDLNGRVEVADLILLLTDWG